MMTSVAFWETETITQMMSPQRHLSRLRGANEPLESFCLGFINLGLSKCVQQVWKRSATAVASSSSLLLPGEFTVNAEQTCGLVNGTPGLVQADPSCQGKTVNKQETVINHTNCISENAMTLTRVFPMSLWFWPVINTLQPK